MREDIKALREGKGVSDREKQLVKENFALR
jgi:hypothetical protein